MRKPVPAAPDANARVDIATAPKPVEVFSYGFRVVGSAPVRIGGVDSDSPAEVYTCTCAF